MPQDRDLRFIEPVKLEEVDADELDNVFDDG